MVRQPREEIVVKRTILATVATQCLINIEARQLGFKPEPNLRIEE